MHPSSHHRAATNHRRIAHCHHHHHEKATNLGALVGKRDRPGAVRGPPHGERLRHEEGGRLAKLGVAKLLLGRRLPLRRLRIQRQVLWLSGLEEKTGKNWGRKGGGGQSQI